MAIEDFELCIRPNPNLTIWRYINLKKFESMLKEKALFFCRVDRFPDPFEGSIPRRIAENRDESLKDTKILSNAHQLFRKKHIVNCWHINNNENDFMWKLYLKSNEGVAIKTTVRKLLDSFSKTSETVFCSKVRYLDYENSTWFNEVEYPFKAYNLFIPLIHKRIEFKQEEEIRLISEIDTNIDDYDIYWNQQLNQNGKNIHLDIKNLIKTIYTHPACDNRQLNDIKRIIAKYNYNFNVIKSKLSNEPYY